MYEGYKSYGIYSTAVIEEILNDCKRKHPHLAWILIHGNEILYKDPNNIGLARFPQEPAIDLCGNFKKFSLLDDFDISYAGNATNNKPKITTYHIKQRI